MGVAPSDRSRTRWSRAWLFMAGALACHVADEALTDFLSVYNPNAQWIRERFGVPLPVFTVEVWLAGLAAAVLAIAAMSIVARRGAGWLAVPGYALAVVMTLNGLGHIGSSIWSGRLMPGVVSSPVLLAASWALWRATRGLPGSGDLRYT